jgi:hypothetical protein
VCLDEQTHSNRISTHTNKVYSCENFIRLISCIRSREQECSNKGVFEACVKFEEGVRLKKLLKFDPNRIGLFELWYSNRFHKGDE